MIKPHRKDCQIFPGDYAAKSYSKYLFNRNNIFNETDGFIFEFPIIKIIEFKNNSAEVVSVDNKERHSTHTDNIKIINKNLVESLLNKISLPFKESDLIYNPFKKYSLKNIKSIYWNNDKNPMRLTSSEWLEIPDNFYIKIKNIPHFKIIDISYYILYNSKYRKFLNKIKVRTEACADMIVKDINNKNKIVEISIIFDDYYPNLIKKLESPGSIWKKINQ